MSRLVLAAALMLLAAGCALRPRYNDVMPKGTAGPEARLLLTEKGTGRPLAEVPVSLGDGKAKVTRLTAADGSFSLPVDAELAKSDPMLVVVLPKDVAGYEVKAAPAPAPERALPDVGVSEPVKPDGPPASEETPAPEAAPEAADGGSEAVSM